MEFCRDVRKFLKNSVIPGIPQIATTRNTCKKALKILVFVCCTIGFIYQTFAFLAVYWTYPTVVDVEHEIPEFFDLPAVTICSYNGINSDRFCRRFPDSCHPNTGIDGFCQKNNRFCDPNYSNYGNESYATVTPRDLPLLSRTEYKAMGTNVKDIVMQCYVRENEGNYDCTNEYEDVHVFDTTGLPNNCYAYNSLWGKTKGAKMIERDSDLVFHLKADRVNSGQFYPGIPFAIQMSLHNPYAILNPFRDGFSIDPCSSYYIYPSKQIKKLLPSPYVTACYNYTATWLARSGKGPITKRLCLEECILNKSMEIAGCADPYYISYPNMEQICQNEPDNGRFYKMCSDFCNPACDQEDIDVDVQEHAHMTTEGVHEEDVCFSTIMISFSRMEILKFTYLPKYEDISLFSYIGGYLGLWLGISLMAFCDVIEMFALAVKTLLLSIGKRRKNKRKRSTQQPRTL